MDNLKKHSQKDKHLGNHARIKIICAGLLFLISWLLNSCFTNSKSAIKPTVDSIRVVIDNNYPPYSFVDDKGDLQGILIDQWQLWEQHTGVNVDIVGLPWGEALERMKAGEFDVIDTIFYTEERAQIFDYTQPYAEINVRIFFRNSISGIANAQSLKGFRVAAKYGDANADYLLEQGITSLVYYDNYEEIVQAAARNEENIFVIDEPHALYFLYRNNIGDEFYLSEPLYSGEFHRAVRKGEPAILELVKRGFASITTQQYREIENRWFGTRQTSQIALFMPYLGGGLFLAFVVIISLFIFNSTLQARVKERTIDLEKSEALFRDSIEFLPIPIGIADKAGTVLEYNHKFTEHYGYTIEDIPTIDKWMETAYPNPDYREKVIAQWNQDIADAELNQTNTPLREYKITGKNGTTHEVEIMMRPAGSIWVTSFVEITERKQAEAQLKRSRERYRAVVDNQTEFIVRWKLDGTRTFVNDAYCHYFGITREEALGSNFLNLIKEEDRPAVNEKIARLTLGTIELETDIHRIIKPDGSIGWQEWTEQAIRDNYGIVTEIQSVGRDITQRKLTEDKLQNSEKRYRALFEDSPVPLLEEDFSAVKKYIDELKKSGVKDFRNYFESHPEATKLCIDLVQIVDVNKSAIKWNKRSSKDELCGSLSLFIAASEYGSFIDELTSLIEDGTHYETSISRHTKSGDPLHLIVNGSVAPGFEETWGRVLVSILDITDRKIAEEKLINAYDNTLWGWAKALEFRDKETEGHSRRVVELTLKLAQAVGVTHEDELIHIRRGTILHDIGKLAIPDEILLKPGKLTKAEWQIMTQHPWLGYKLLSSIDFLEDSLDIVRYHHEKWDGSGYLIGLQGKDIPLAARIFAIVDVWDAIQTDRPYKKAWSREKAITFIKQNAGTHFDPKIVQVFLKLIENDGI